MLGLDCTWDGSSILSALAIDVKVHVHFQRITQNAGCFSASWAGFGLCNTWLWSSTSALSKTPKIIDAQFPNCVW